jgi:hypothetical protein
LYYAGGYSVISDASVSNIAARDLTPTTVVCRDSSGTQITCTAPALTGLACANAVIGVEVRISFRVDQSKLMITRFDPFITLGTINFQSATVVEQIPQSFSVVYRNVSSFDVGKCFWGCLPEIWKSRIHYRITSFGG